MCHSGTTPLVPGSAIGQPLLEHPRRLLLLQESAPYSFMASTLRSYSAEMNLSADSSPAEVQTRV